MTLGSPTNSILAHVAVCLIGVPVKKSRGRKSIILESRERVIEKLAALGKPVPASLKDWRVKTVTDALTKVFDNIDPKTQRELRERFEAYWTAFPH